MAMNLVKLPTGKPNLQLRVSKGHYATSHSHINYYITAFKYIFCSNCNIDNSSRKVVFYNVCFNSRINCIIT